MKQLIMALAILGLLMLEASPALAAASTQTQSYSISIEESLGPGGFLGHPCGTGDVIQMTGYLHIVVHTTRDAAGGFHHRVATNLQGISGTGLVSGTDYLMIRTTNISTQETNGAQVTMDVSGTNRLVAKAGEQGFSLHSMTHLTFNANGELTSWVVTFRPSCEIIS